MCMISLFFLQTWQEEDSVYLDQPIYGWGTQQSDSWLLNTTKWNSTSNYFMSDHTSPHYGNNVSSQISNTQFHSPTTSSSSLYLTSDKSMTQFGSGYDLLPAQHFNVFHHNQNANQSTFSNTIQYHTAQSVGQTDISKAMAMASQSAPAPRHAMSRSAKAPTIALVAQVTPMAITTFDANYNINNRKASDDDPFGGGDIGGVENPDEPNMPLGDVPILFILLMAIGYIAFIHHKQKANNNVTNL